MATSNGVKRFSASLAILSLLMGSLTPQAFASDASPSSASQNSPYSQGVLAINTDQAVYAPGQQVLIQMASLDNTGHTLCDSNLELKVAPPDGNIQSFSTNSTSTSQSIQHSSSCGNDNVTNNPDYFSSITATAVGDYHMVLTNPNAGISVDNYFTVQNNLNYIVKRQTATRINPFKSSYQVNISIQFRQDFKGQVEEFVQDSFELSNYGFAQKDVVQDSKVGIYQRLTWPLNVQAGDTANLSYTYQAPKVSPELFKVGFLQLTLPTMQELLAGKIIGLSGAVVLAENKVWEIASDGLCIAKATGNWSASATWGGSCSGNGGAAGVPGTADTAIVGAGKTVTVDVATATAANVYISTTTSASTGVLQFNSGTILTVSSNTVVGSSSRAGTLTMTSGGTLITGTLTVPGTGTITFTPGTGTVQITKTVTLPNNKAFATYNNLTVNGSAITVTVGYATTTLKGSLTMTAGTLAGTNSLKVVGSVSGSGTISMTGGTFEVDSTGNFGTSVAWNFFNLNIGGTTTLATITSVATATITVTSDLVIGTGSTLNAGSNVWVFSGAGTSFFPGGTFNAQTSTFDFTSTAAASIPTQTYYNLIINPVSGSPTFTFDNNWILATSTMGSGSGYIDGLGFDSTNGAIYAGAGTNGGVYKCVTSTGCTSAGNWVLATTTPANSTQNYAFSFDATNGAMYFGSGPTMANIYKCSPSGTANSCTAAVPGSWQQATTTNQTYIFSSTIDTTNGAIYAGSGATTGLIYKCILSTGCTSAGNWKLATTSPDAQIDSLAFDSVNGVLYAGSGVTTGRIYKCVPSAAANSCTTAGSWTLATTTAQTVIRAFAIDTTNNVIYAVAGFTTGDVFRCVLSTGCASAGNWIRATTTAATSINSLAFDSNAGVMYAIAGGNSVANGKDLIYKCFVSTGCASAGNWTLDFIGPITETDFNASTYDSVNGDVYTGSFINGYIYKRPHANATTTISNSLLIGDGTDAVTVNANTFNTPIVIQGEATVSAVSNFNPYTLTVSASGHIFQNLGTTTLSNNFVITAGTLSGTGNMTVKDGSATGNGTINMTGGTFEMNGTGNFGGSSAWTFYNLNIGNNTRATTTSIATATITVTSVLSIGSTSTLNAGSNIWLLSGNGTPFVNSGTFNAQTSTVSYRGTSGNIAVANATYNNVDYSPASGSPTFQLSSSVGSSWYDSAWGFRKTITISHNLIASSTGETYANFPVLVSLPSDGSLYANAQSNGNDVLFTSADGTTKLNHEIEQYATSTSAATSSLIAWVKVPSLSTSSDTTLYMYYGNSSAASQATTTGVWDGNYRAVYHFTETSGGSGAIKDSTSNGNNETPQSGTTLGAAGKVNSAITFNGTSGYLNSTWKSSQDISGNITLEAWVLQTAISRDRDILNKDDATDADYEFYYDSNNYVHFYSFGLSPSGANSTGQITDTTTWHHVALVHSGTTSTFYIDGTASGSTTQTGSLPTVNTRTLNMGAANTAGTASNFFPGTIDEPRVSAYARSADWIKTEFNNQNSPSTFETVGSQSVGGVGVAAYVVSGNMKVGDGSHAVTLDANSNAAAIAVSGNLTISSSSTLSAPGSANITLSGNFINNGTYTANGGTVVLTPSSTSTITTSANMSFNNLTLASAGKAVQFTASSNGISPVFTIGGTFTVTGQNGSLITIQSDTPGTQWLVHFSSTQTNITYAYIKDSGCDGTSALVTETGKNNSDGGQNGACWQFVIVTVGGGGGSIEGSTPATDGGGGGGSVQNGGNQGGSVGGVDGGGGGGSVQNGGGVGGGGGGSSP